MNFFTICRIVLTQIIIGVESSFPDISTYSFEKESISSLSLIQKLNISFPLSNKYSDNF